MRAAFRWLGLLGVIALAGCATPAKVPVPDSAKAILPASEEQIQLGGHRAAFIYGRWSKEARAKFSKSGATLLAVKTLNLTPEQAVSLGGKIPAPETAVCIVIWDAKTEKVVGTDCYVVLAPPERGMSARFGPHTAQYVGSL